MKQLYFSFFLILFTFPIYSQQTQIDSLKNRLKVEKENEDKLEILTALSRQLIVSQSPQESLPYFEQMAKLAKYENNVILESRAYRYIAESYIKLNDSSPAYNYASKALRLNDENVDINEYLLNINQLARAYDYFQSYEKAIATYLLGLRKYEKIGKSENPKVLSQIFLNLSQAYKRIGKSDKAIETLIKGVDWAEKINDPTGISFGLYSLGWEYMEQENFKKAETYYLKSLKYSDSVALPIYISINHRGLGINYSRWGKYDKALAHNNIALNNFEKAGNDLYAFDVLNNIAVVYEHTNVPDSTEFYAKRALDLAYKLNHKLAISGAKQTLASANIKQKKFNAAEILLLDVAKDTIDPSIISSESKVALLKSLALVYEGIGNYSKSLEFYKRYHFLDDSLQSGLRNSNFADIETKYQTEKKEKENLQLKTEKAQQELLTQKAHTQRWILLVILTVLVAFAYLIWRRYKKEADARRTIQLQKGEIEKQKIIIEILHRDLHHRLKNHLSFIDLFINLAKTKFPAKVYHDKLNDLQNRLRSMYEVNNQLLKSDDLSSVCAKNYIDTLVENIKQAYVNPKVSVINLTSEDVSIHATLSFPVGLIINEFVTNSFKHAFDDNEKGNINISLTSDDHYYQLQLSDDGKGLPDDFDIGALNSFGMEIMQLLTKEYNGSFFIDGSAGLTINITLPKNTKYDSKSPDTCC